jgi:hypothetical protein
MPLFFVKKVIMYIFAPALRNTKLVNGEIAQLVRAQDS